MVLAMLLEVKNLCIKYGQAVAVKDVSLDIGEGEVVSILGANGAGKTSTIRAISGLKKPVSGEVWFAGRRIDRLPAHQIARLGVVQVPAGRQIFGPMSVLDNLKIGACQRRDKSKVKQDLEAMFEHFPRLKERQSQLGGSLSGGEQQMLAVARALMSSPKLILMDEPSIGLSPLMVAEIGRIITDINQRGLSILLVEQNCRMALKLSARAYVMELGRVSLSGACDVLANDEQVQKCYLGAV
jgi:branched-chain amino acid transport system ATP-binding protein